MADLHDTIVRLKSYANTMKYVVLVRRRTIEDAIELLEKQKKRIEALKIDLDIITERINWHSCSTCKVNCDNRPEPGEQVRSNCFYWSDIKGRYVTTSESTKGR